MARDPSRSMRPRMRPGMEDIDNNVTRLTGRPRRPVKRPEDRAEEFRAGRAAQRGDRAARLMAQDLEDFSQNYADGGMVRGCKSSQMSGKGFSGSY